MVKQLKKNCESHKKILRNDKRSLKDKNKINQYPYTNK